jgi:hypothetical protein
MPKDVTVRWGWLKLMYIYTIVGDLIAIPFRYVFTKQSDM